MFTACFSVPIIVNSLLPYLEYIDALILQQKPFISTNFLLLFHVKTTAENLQPRTCVLCALRGMMGPPLRP